MDVEERFDLSRTDQLELIEQVADQALTDQTVGELARLVEQEHLTSTYEVDKVSTVEADNKKATDSGTVLGNKTKHAEERIVERGVSESAIRDTLNNPLFVGEVVVDAFGRKSVRYIGTDATVILNPDTEAVITTWKTGSRIRKKYGGNG